MAVQNTDFLLVHRGGTDYKTTVEKFLEIIPTPDLEGVLTFKGTVDSESNLPNGASTGDFYITTDTEEYFAFNGSEWQNVGRLEVDLEPYATKDELTDGLSGKADSGHSHDEYLVQADIDGLATRKEVTDGLTKEAADRADADKVLQDQIDGLDSYDDTALSQSVSELSSGLEQEVKDRIEGDKALAEAIEGLEPYDDAKVKEDIKQLQDGFDTAVIAAQEGKENLILELSSYSKKTHKHEEYLTADDLPEVEAYDDSELRELIGGKADADHGHDDLATKEELSDGLAGKAEKEHVHPEYDAGLIELLPIPDGIEYWENDLELADFQNVQPEGQFGVFYDAQKNQSSISLPTSFGQSQAPWQTKRVFIDGESYEFFGGIPTNGGNVWLIVTGDARRGRTNGNVYTIANWHAPLYVTHDELEGLLPAPFNVGDLDDLPA